MAERRIQAHLPPKMSSLDYSAMPLNPPFSCLSSSLPRLHQVFIERLVRAKHCNTCLREIEAAGTGKVPAIKECYWDGQLNERNRRALLSFPRNVRWAEASLPHSRRGDCPGGRALAWPQTLPMVGTFLLTANLLTCCSAPRPGRGPRWWRGNTESWAWVCFLLGTMFRRWGWGTVGASSLG